LFQYYVSKEVGGYLEDFGERQGKTNGGQSKIDETEFSKINETALNLKKWLSTSLVVEKSCK